MRYLGLLVTLGNACSTAQAATAAPPTIPNLPPARPPSPTPESALTPVAPLSGAQDQPAVTLPGASQVDLPNNWTFGDVMGSHVALGQEVSPAALGVGAVAGVVAFNMLAQYAFPGSNLLAPSFVAETDLAASRIYAIGSAVAGALAGQYIYDQAVAEKTP